MAYLSLISLSFLFPLLVTLPGFLFQFSFQYLAFSSTPEAVSGYISFFLS